MPVEPAVAAGGLALHVFGDLRVRQDEKAFFRHRLDHHARHFRRLQHAIDPRGARARRRHAGLHRLRTQHGHADAAVAILNGEMLGERHRRILRHAIRHRVQRRQQSRGGSRVEEIAGAAREHARHQRARREHMAHDMDAPAHVPIGVGGGLLSLAREAGVGKEHVDRAIFVFGGGDQRLDVFLQPDIGGDRQSIDIAGDLCQSVARSLEVGDDDAARAGFRIGARHRFADAARSAGDDADLALDVHVGSPLVSCS